MTMILISNNPDTLNAELNKSCSTATVGAQFGRYTVKGSPITMAHDPNCPYYTCPCTGDNINDKFPIIYRIGVNHFDLDILGGVMRILGLKNYDPQGGLEFDTDEVFWEVAARVGAEGINRLDDILDNMMPEKLSCSDGPDSTCPSYGSSLDRWNDHISWIRQSLNAFWAWEEKNPLKAPDDGSALDCTKFFREAARVLTLILENCEDDETQALIRAGNAWSECHSVITHSQGVKHDDGKILAGVLQEWSLALTAVLEVSTYGAKEYGRGNWLYVENGVERYTDAMFRHLLKEEVEVTDPASGLTHDAHVAWNALSRLELRLRETKLLRLSKK